MTSFAQLLGDPFYDRFEDTARQLVEQSRQLLAVLQAAKADRRPAVSSAPKAPALADLISKRVVHTLKTGMERENIEGMARALSHAARTMVRCEQRLALIPQGGVPIDLTAQGALLTEAAGLLATLVGGLRTISDLGPALELRNRLQACESESDRLSAEGLRDLYGRPLQAVMVVALKDLIELLGEAVGDCCDAADLTWRIFMQNN